MADNVEVVQANALIALKDKSNNKAAQYKEDAKRYWGCNIAWGTM
jgi:hypothetical protein